MYREIGTSEELSDFVINGNCTMFLLSRDEYVTVLAWITVDGDLYGFNVPYETDDNSHSEVKKNLLNETSIANLLPLKVLWHDGISERNFEKALHEHKKKLGLRAGIFDIADAMAAITSVFKGE